MCFYYKWKECPWAIEGLGTRETPDASLYDVYPLDQNGKGNFRGASVAPLPKVLSIPSLPPLNRTLL